VSFFIDFQGMYDKAEQLYQRFFSMQEQLVDSDSLCVATSLNNLADMLRTQVGGRLLY